jgi:hypothetical protein
MPLPFKRISASWRILVVFLCFGLAFFMSGIRSWPDQIRGMRPGNKYEEFDRFIAQQLDEPNLCSKISWTALLSGGFFIAPSYTRSECYDFIAGRTRNPWLCWKVKRYGAVSLFSSQTSMWSCLSHAFHGWNGGVGINPDDLTAFFNEMGYDPDTLHLEGITPPIVNVKDIYGQLPNRTDLLMRIEKVNGVSDPASLTDSNDVEDAAYLDEMAALVSKDARRCLQIPQGMKLAGEPQTFRDWCLLKLATNTKNGELCRQIPIPEGTPDPLLSLQATCLFQTNSLHPNNTVYAPEVPSDDAQARRLIIKLNYEIPRAKDLPSAQIYEAYSRFLDELEKHLPDPSHVAARQRFLERVYRLPDGSPGATHSS